MENNMMKLSEAIRLGAMMKPQAYASSLTTDGRTCALGAALDAIGRASSSYSRAFDWFPICSQEAIHPVFGETMLVLSVVRLLNDEDLWTREAIADWVETIEPRSTASATDDGGLRGDPVVRHPMTVGPRA